MDKILTFGDYTFTLLDENGFGDLQEVSESTDSAGHKKMFEWLLAKQSWFFLYVVRHKDEIIGKFEIRTINHSIKFYEIGVEIKQAHRNMGHGTQMIKHMNAKLKQLGSSRIQAVVPTANKSSNCMCRSAGMKLEATLKNYTVTVAHDPCDANIYSVTF